MSLQFRMSLILAIFLSLGCYREAMANMPVFDVSNLLENIKQTVEQIEQGKRQMAQYENMLENSKSLDRFTWDKANLTMDNLMNSINTLDSYKQQMGGLDGYLSRYQSSEHYTTSSCLNGNGCTAAQLQALNQQSIDASKAQKRANDAMFRGIDKQQSSMKTDAVQLRQLQQQAQDSKGQMQAIQAANQLASAETNQLLQIRGLLVAAQNAEATRASALADREAIQMAADARFRGGKFKKSPSKSW